MSVQPIRLLGDPVLRTPATAVATFDKELRTLVRDLRETMLEAGGAGLAAPQVGVSLRVFTYDVDEVVGHLVNPVIVTRSTEEQDGEEGCLSVPGMYWPLVRAQTVVATGFNEYGDPVTLEGSEVMARCIQHETDHLDGVLFVDLLDPETKKAAMKAIREAEWAQPPVVKASPHPLYGLGR